MKISLNCELNYIQSFLSKQESESLYKELVDTFKIDSLKTKINFNEETSLSDYGKIMFIDEELLETNAFPEEIWGKTSVWSEKLIDVKNKVEKVANRVFSVCVCIYYPDGNSGVDFHSDFIAFGDTNLIPSLSIGAERAFHLRDKRNFKIHELILEEGSLLIMGKGCQQNYEHSLPVNPKYKKGRINLTFRPYGFN